MYGFTIYNTLRAIPVRLITHNVGNVDSVGNVVFLAGVERYACPHATFMFHGVAWGFQGDRVTGQQARELLANIDADERRISAAVAERTNLSATEVDAFFREAATKDAQF